MVESKLRVVSTEEVARSNPYYGKMALTNITESNILCDFDKRKNIAPSGIYATIIVKQCGSDGKVITKKHFEITINKYKLEYESSGSYVTTFIINGCIYEIYVRFGEDNKIEDLVLSEWLEIGYFEDGENCDNEYHLEDFLKYYALNS